MVSADPGTTQRRSDFRTDINGLRALAIVPVVLFHAGLVALPGGFVGVDVFFVISGFLITQLLLREIDATGRVALLTFWARRIRRLVPALTLVVVTCLVTALALGALLRPLTTGVESMATLLFVSNFLFAVQDAGYFNDSVIASPLLHTWSLSVEEQFYLLWPLLLVVLAVAARRFGGSPRNYILGAFVVMLVGSLALSVVLTAIDPVKAFYLLPTRAWEFAAGGVIACTAPFRFGSRVAATLGILGAALLAVSYLWIDETVVAFPGWVGVVPVAGVAAIILAGHTTGDVSGTPMARFLSLRPVQVVGDVSYSWYLWHWPVVVYIEMATLELTWVSGTVAVAGSFALAVASYHLVENPVRFHPSLVRSVGRTLAAGATLVVTGILASTSFLVAANAATNGGTLGALEAATTTRPARDCPQEASTPSGRPMCVYGDSAAEHTVLLLGDSHAGQWAEAFGLAAERRGLRLVVSWLPACPAAPLDVVSFQGTRADGCGERQQSALELAEELTPDAVVVAQAATYEGRVVSETGAPLPDHEQLAEWRRANLELFTTLSGITSSVGVVKDNPRLPYDPNLCLASWWRDGRDCAVDVATAFAPNAAMAEVDAEVWAEAGVTDIFDPTPLFCSEGTGLCEVEQGGMPVFIDYNHLSRMWTNHHADEVADYLDSLLLPG